MVLFDRVSVLRSIALVAVLVSLVACSDIKQSGESVQFGVTALEPYETLDTKFLKLDQINPGFGGMFFDEQGLLNVHIAGTTNELERMKPSVMQAILSVFSADELMNGFLSIPGVSPAGLDITQRTKLTSVKYAWSDLYKWNQIITPLLVTPGVNSIDINEETNSLTVGFSDSASLPQLQRETAELGIPLEAVDFVEEPATVAGATLDDEVRPIYGGLRIDMLPGGECTLGLNVRRNGVRGFITNSHCSSRQFQDDSTNYAQPVYSSFTQIGTEAVDPNYFTNTTRSDCPVGTACRYSDANFVDYHSSYSPLQARFYTTTLNDPPPHDLTIRGTLVTQGEAAGTPIVGSYAAKVGQTTGFTEGRVTNACYRSTYDKRSYDDKQVYLFCTHRVAANFYYGDSGSPVLLRTSSSGPKIRGVAWGFGGSLADNTKYFTFSDLNGIRHELGGTLITSN